jgi:hypothetical protein
MTILHMPAAMKLAMDIAQAFVGNMGINLGCHYALVAQKLLNRAQIGSLR